MPSFTLTDVGRDLWVENFAIDAASVESPSAHAWSVTKRALRGGRRDGVDLIQVNNGVFTFSIVPTRGMGLWKGHLGGDRVGWDSPVGDGPVNPAFVNLMNWGGLGWLEGFDELVARCGLENNGAPYEEKVTNPDGSERHTTYGLHGKIANIPASFVAVHVGTEPPYEIVVEGHVEESKLFAPQIRMTTRVSTTPGSNRLTVRDEFLNLKDAPGEMQLLYHWNFGPPYLEEGARFVAPVKVMAPRDAWAATAIDHYETYRAPEPGFAEQCYFFELQASQADGRTLTMLRNKAGDKGVVLRFSPAQLPAFTLWKCTGGLKEGYVTGLEPATNYPNPKPFEKARHRVVALPAGGRYVAEMTLEVLSTGQAVAAVEAEIQAIQAQATPTIHRKSTEPFGPQD
ncbi:aldose 1-epimerase family protein [Singulisphaera acidiphila]|uniref:Galactose mutarotase-like enzyme n=1 Tax=Singulisphaera acidiphila (strain ATCC BAA-1392 / DSM 18658 / VKM B-2454 / MOB10) TaxID=886293 RepID=L0DFT2_SINAD|nr:aldose 1-epimerase family protein [Singulisphaera acidiphila]AGA27516.1 hypothetical protein Sinac_3245 [Singulisphaera acidiphila DSM 18658]